ncbi:MAG: UDP-glucose/GDP-mannose dehydrogenase family protein [Alphaproteobacteria bacterium]|nr:UDP-glucose/GDP-mannose dehydrogenase family protein [Alphaproteobacteria bacterium]MCB9930563.1 UDP-glucose/GDP-mannose dehydrogenase family protein [Alphaproteobacteria bacterium]
MNIVMIGAGYVGLVTGTCFAEFGFDVTCVDVNPQRIRALRQGEIPIFEPGLREMVVRLTAAGRLHFTDDLAMEVPEADLVFIAVGTPESADGSADLRYVFGAAEQIARSLQGETVVVTKSTVPVGTNRRIREVLARNAPAGAEWDLVSNPEFLREGAALEDFLNPDRVIVGCESERAKAAMDRLYQPLSSRGVPVLYTDLVTAELIKYAANGFLATKITFINEMADLCEKAGADVQQVARGIGMDDRIGPRFLAPGPGYGGSCFPKDTAELAHTARHAYGTPLRIIETVSDINDKRKFAMAERVVAALGGRAAARGKTVAVLGLTFKPETDDMRESPALVIVPELLKAGIAVRAFDPEGMATGKAELGDGPYYARDPDDALSGADCVAIVTEWRQFRSLPVERVKALMKAPVMVDMRNLYDPAEMRAAGFTYYGIGRGYAAEPQTAG